MSNFDNFTPTSVESSFESQLVISKKGKGKCVNSDSNASDDELDKLESLIKRRLSRGRGKYKGKLPLIYFSCNKVGHISARCSNRENKDEKRERKYKGRSDDWYNRRNKDYKDKGKKYCYISEEETDNEFESNDEEVVYGSMKEDFDED